MPFVTVAGARPDGNALEETLRTQRTLPETFSGPLTPTRGFRFSRRLEPLGSGEETFLRAVRGLEAWAVYPPWIALSPHPAPLERGACVAFVAGFAPFWAVSTVRVTEVSRSARHLAVTLRTLPQHALTGAERFHVYRDESDTVMYELTALSRPHHPLAKLGAPAVRLTQRRFVRDSVRSLRTFMGTASDYLPGQPEPDG